MSKKIYDPFAKMSKEEIDAFIQVDVESRNLKKKETKKKEEKKPSKVA